MAYDAQRAMFEAYSRNKYISTGVIQWMLNNAWPSLIWHLDDYNLEPAGGYFGTKKATEAIHILYPYDDRSIVVVNSTYKPVRGMKASVGVFDFDLKERFSRETAVDVDADGVRKLLEISGTLIPIDRTNRLFCPIKIKGFQREDCRARISIGSQPRRRSSIGRGLLGLFQHQLPLTKI